MSVWKPKTRRYDCPFQQAIYLIGWLRSLEAFLYKPEIQYLHGWIARMPREEFDSLVMSVMGARDALRAAMRADTNERT